MKIGQIRTLIEDKGDDEMVFAPWFDKEEADEHLINNMDMENVELTADEWELIVNKLSNDDGIWNELYESFRYYIEQVIESREKSEANDSSE